MRKPFDQDQHDQDDHPAKEKVRNFLINNWNVRVIVGKLYDADLICYRGSDVVGYVEVERRHNWVDEFPFPTIHVPARKEKFFRLEKPTVIFSVRSDLAKAMWCWGENVLSSPIKFLNNKHCDNEDFFVVPIKHWKLVKL